MKAAAKVGGRLEKRLRWNCAVYAESTVWPRLWVGGMRAVFGWRSGEDLLNDWTPCMVPFAHAVEHLEDKKGVPSLMKAGQEDVDLGHDQGEVVFHFIYVCRLESCLK